MFVLFKNNKSLTKNLKNNFSENNREMSVLHFFSSLFKVCVTKREWNSKKRVEFFYLICL